MVKIMETYKYSFNKGKDSEVSLTLTADLSNMDKSEINDRCMKDLARDFAVKFRNLSEKERNSFLGKKVDVVEFIDQHKTQGLKDKLEESRKENERLKAQLEALKGK